MLSKTPSPKHVNLCKSLTLNPNPGPGARELFVDNLLVRNHFIIVMIWWTGLAPWEFEFPFPGSLTSTFLMAVDDLLALLRLACPSSNPYRGTSLIRSTPPVGPYSSHMPRDLW